MAGEVIYGQNVAVSGEATVEQMAIRWVGRNPFLGASNTEGAVEREAGNVDWLAVYRLRGHTPNVFPNDEVTFSGTFAGGGASKALTGTARVQRILIEWDIRSGEYIRSQVFLGANGSLTTGTEAIDISEPASVTAKGKLLKIDTVTQNHVDFMRLMISAYNQVEYVDSDTDGQVYRTTGDIDAQASWRQSSDDPADFQTVGARVRAQFYVSDTAFWDIQWLRIAGIDPWEKDRRDRTRPVQFVTNAEFTGFCGTSPGYIFNPAGTKKWPST